MQTAAVLPSIRRRGFDHASRRPAQARIIGRRPKIRSPQGPTSRRRSQEQTTTIMRRSRLCAPFPVPSNVFEAQQTASTRALQHVRVSEYLRAFARLRMSPSCDDWLCRCYRWRVLAQQHGDLAAVFDPHATPQVELTYRCRIQDPDILTDAFIVLLSLQSPLAPTSPRGT